MTHSVPQLSKCIYAWECRHVPVRPGVCEGRYIALMASARMVVTYGRKFGDHQLAHAELLGANR